MPYFGVLSHNGRELRTNDYYRLDASNTRFKISPPMPAQGLSDMITFVNIDPLVWPEPKGTWHVSGVAIYDEPDSSNPLVSCPLVEQQVDPGGILVLPAGGLRFGWYGRSSGEPSYPDVTSKLKLVEDQNARMVYALKAARELLPPESTAYKLVCAALDNRATV